jgi:hypothetical protein
MRNMRCFTTVVPAGTTPTTPRGWSTEPVGVAMNGERITRYTRRRGSRAATVPVMATESFTQVTWVVWDPCQVRLHWLGDERIPSGSTPMESIYGCFAKQYRTKTRATLARIFER